MIALDLDVKRQLLFIGTSSSTIFILKTAAQQINTFKQAHNSEVVGIDVQGNCLVSHDKKGNLKFWNLGSLHTPSACAPNNPLNNAEGTCVAFGDAPFALQGFSSGDITCVNSQGGKVEWSILKSHKGGVSTLVMVSLGIKAEQNIHYQWRKRWLCPDMGPSQSSHHYSIRDASLSHRAADLRHQRP